MDLDPHSSSPRKVKFAPKGPPRRPPKPVAAKTEAAAEDDGGDDETQHQALSERVKEHLTRRGPKAEKKSSVQVAFSHGVASTALKTYGKPRERADDTKDVVFVKELASDNRQNLVTSTSAGGEGVISESSFGLSDSLILKKKRGYNEPWDYRHSYYPTTLPWRKPYSGDPEILDEAEFGEAAEYNENTLHSASDLGLLDQDDAPRMLFMQFPANLPLGDRPTSIATFKGKEKIDGSSPLVSGTSTGMKGKQVSGSSMNSTSGHPSKKKSGLEELPEGYMGKMLVYKSGRVKLKLGDILYDVSPGSDSVSAQNVVAINTISRHCCDLGELNKRAVVTPDIDSIVDHVIDLS